MRVTGSVSGSASGLLNVEGDGDKIEVTQVLSEGTKIATITINEGTEEEETIDLYAPEGFSGSWNDLTDKPTLFSGVYSDLSGKPYLNGNVISGNMYSDIYSTDEQIVGVWIDGKPLYKRTFSGLDSPTNGYEWATLSGVDASTFDELVHLQAYTYVNDKLTNVCLAEYRIYNNNVQLSLVNSIFNRTINVATLYYTKTTVSI